MTAPQTPNMFLTVPVIGQTLDPQWATYLNQDLYLVDSHDHSPGKGALITPAAMSINADLSYYNHALLNASYVSFYPQTVAPTAANTFYWGPGGELYLTNGAGAPFQMTTGSGTALSLPGTTFAFPTVTTAVSLIIPNGAPYNYVLCDTTIALSITLPAAITAVNRFFFIRDFQGTGANTNNISIVPSGADTLDGLAIMTMDETRGGVMFESDGVSAWSATFFTDYNLARRVKIDGTSLVLRKSNFAEAFKIVDGTPPQYIMNGYMGDGVAANLWLMPNNHTTSYGPGSIWHMYAGSSAVLEAVMGVQTIAGAITVSNLGNLNISGTGHAHLIAGAQLTCDTVSVINISGSLNFIVGTAATATWNTGTNLTCHGAAYFDGANTFNGTTTVNLIGAGSSINGDATSYAGFAGTTVINGPSSTIDGGIAFAATVTQANLEKIDIQNGPMRILPTGVFAHQYVAGPAGSQNILISYGDMMMIGGTTVSGSVYTLSNTDAISGCRWEIAWDPTLAADDSYVTIHNNAGATIATIARTVGAAWGYTFLFNGSAWKAFRRSM